MDEVVSVDGRGRVSLGRLLPEGVTQFLAHREPDGSILLEPAVTVSVAEARLHANPDLLARIEASVAEPERATEVDLNERRTARRRG